MTMRFAPHTISMISALALGACQEAPKSVEYWLAHKEELREMERVCLTNGAAGQACENVARASSRISEEASDRRIKALRAARGE